jgi:hypothetical protein
MKIDMEKTMTEFGIDCWKCSRGFTMMANEIDVHHWQDGVAIQEALGYLTADERELFISGTCGECFDKMFPPDPEDFDSDA